MTNSSNRTILLSERPSGKLQREHFSIEDRPMPGAPGPGEVLCRTILLSISPGSRAWIQQAPTYREGGDVGEPMSAYTLAEVIAENSTALQPGMIVSCQAAWQEYSLLPEAAVQSVRVRGPLPRHMSVFGTNGLTAYFGMTRVGAPAPGQTVVVSAAAGSVGSLAGQLARIAGARVVGVTGSETKNALLTGELGFDAAVNHRSENFTEQLADACPNGIDVYFDNVGGKVLEAALNLMNEHGTIACCGAVAHYDGPAGDVSTRGVPLLVITKRLTMQGFLVFDFKDEFDDALDRLEELVRSGELRVLEDVREGIDSAPEALVDLLAGVNVGKVMVRVGPDA